MQNIVLAGAPGCGKGTQASFLKENCPDLLVVQTMSELLRRRAQKHDNEAQIIKHHMRNGGLVPDNITTEVFFEEIQRLQFVSAGDIFVSDGFPRTLGQYCRFKNRSVSYQCENLVVIHLKLPEDATGEVESIRRMMKRSPRPEEESTENYYRQRLAVFKEETLPFLRRVDKESHKDREGCWINYVEIDANQPPEVIHQLVISGLKKAGIPLRTEPAQQII